MSTGQIVVIERETAERAYGFRGCVAIVEHPIHGRLLIQDGYGGDQTMRGGAVRWEHGTVIRLHPTDTLASLRSGAWSEMASLWDAVCHGYDDSRPMLEWTGSMIARVAARAGIA